MKFDIEALKQIPIEDVLEMFGARKSKYSSYGKTLSMHCFCGMHENGDRHPSLIVWKDKNICKCMINPEIKGDVISIVKKVLFNGDFKEACIWLHENFNIPYLEDAYNKEKYEYEKIKNKHYILNSKTNIKKSTKDKKIEFIKLKEYKEVNDLEKYYPLYQKMKPHQKLKFIYTFIYRFSLKTNQTSKLDYYKSRKINKVSLIDKIGCLNKEDIEALEEQLLNTFPVEDLIKFKLINDDKHKKPYKFKYITKEAFCVVPSFDINSNLVNGLILRATKTFEFQKAKEFQVSCYDISIPIPFSFERVDLNKDEVIITEGHIDMLSIAQYVDLNKYAFLAIPGIYNAKEEYLYLLKNKNVYIFFDQDEAGQTGAKKLKEKLIKYTTNIKIANWNIEFGKDLNEVLQNGYIKYILEKFKINK